MSLEGGDELDTLNDETFGDFGDEDDALPSFFSGMGGQSTAGMLDIGSLPSYGASLEDFGLELEGASDFDPQQSAVMSGNADVEMFGLELEAMLVRGLDLDPAASPKRAEPAPRAPAPAQKQQEQPKQRQRRGRKKQPQPAAASKGVVDFAAIAAAAPQGAARPPPPGAGMSLAEIEAEQMRGTDAAADVSAAAAPQSKGGRKSWAALAKPATPQKLTPGEAEMASRVAAAEARRREAAGSSFAGVAPPPARPVGTRDSRDRRDRRDEQEARRQRNRATAAVESGSGSHLESLLLKGSSRMKPGDISFVVRSHVRSLERCASASGKYYVMMMAKKRAEAALAEAAAESLSDADVDAAAAAAAEQAAAESAAPAGADDLSKILAPYLVRRGGQRRGAAKKVAAAAPTQQDANELAASWAQHHKQLGIMAKSSIRAPRQLLNIRAMYGAPAARASGGVVWEWEAFEAGSGVWHRYNASDAVALEEAYEVYGGDSKKKSRVTITNSTGSCVARSPPPPRARARFAPRSPLLPPFALPGPARAPQ
jgi:hypothetical protein